MGNNKDGFGSEEPPGIRRAYMSELEIISKSRLSERLTCRPTPRGFTCRQGAKLGGPVWLAVEQQQHWSDSAAAFSPPPATPGNTHLLGLSHLKTGEEGGEGGVTT